MSIKAYKGFDKNMTCRGFQFKEGETYEEEKVELCCSGFHACEHPLGCFGYYSPASSIYHEVVLDDLDPRTEEDTKRAGKKITIGARIDIAGMVKAAIDFVFAKADWSNAGEHATGYQGVACALGIEGKAKAKIGGWIVCAEWKEMEVCKWERIDVRCAKVDGENIKGDTWYTLRNGDFIEVKE